MSGARVADAMMPEAGIPGSETSDNRAPVTRMFPLGTVLFPGQALPLQVFEERYLEMMEQCLAEDRGENRSFGVVLIERGSEVGGGDVRKSVGCLAEIVAHRSLGDSRLAVLAVGSSRIKVKRWLEESSYPRAETEIWPDEDVTAPATRESAPAAQKSAPAAQKLLHDASGVGKACESREASRFGKAGVHREASGFEEVFQISRRIWGLRKEMGFAVPDFPASLEEADYGTVGSFKLAAQVPFQELDRYKLLSAPSLAERMQLLVKLMEDHEELLLAHLNSPGPTHSR